jgi:glycosyltransferase involved in cell wall biosynthesis
VVCAEALCCGTPVIASRVGGIPSFVNEGNGELVDANDAGTWAATIERSAVRIAAMDRGTIAREAGARFEASRVGAQLDAILRHVGRGEPLPVP